MPLSRRELLAAGAASLAAGVSTQRTAAAAAPQVSGSLPRAGKASHPPNVTIRDYLVREARRITDHAINDLKSPAEVTRRLGERRQQFLRTLGLGDLRPAAERGPVPHKITGVIQRKGFRIEKLHYESLPNLHVTANLYVPTAATADVAPARHPLRVRSRAETEGVTTRRILGGWRSWASRRLIVETVQLGEVTGYHHGCYREGWFHWYSRGYSPAAIEVFNGIRGLDLLASRPEVDATAARRRPASPAAARRPGGSRRPTSASRPAAPVCGTATLGVPHLRPRHRRPLRLHVVAEHRRCGISPTWAR